MSQFDQAFLLTMKQEVNSNFSDTDPDVIAGLCDTKIHKDKVGYVNNVNDSGRGN